MKKRFVYYSGLSLLIVFGWACQSPDQQQDQQKSMQVIITGKVDHSEDSTVSFSYPPFNKWHRFETTLDEQGRFRISFELDAPRYLRFLHGGEYTYLFATPTDSIHMTLDAKQFDETLQYSGDGALRNQYLARKVLLEDSVIPGLRKLYKYPFDTFTQKLGDQQATYMDLYQTIADSAEVSAKFKNLEQRNILLKTAYTRLRYPAFHKHFAKVDSAPVDPDFYTFMNDLELNDPDNLKLPVFYSLARFYTKHLRSELVEKDTTLLDTPRIRVRHKAIQQTFPNDTVRGMVLAQLLYRHYRLHNTAHTKPLLSELGQLPVGPAVRDSLQNLWDKWQRIAKGKQAPGFAYPDISGDTVALEDLRGKYVYIDVWATWCGPCRKEIPHLKKLEHALKDENIAFVSVSIDAAEDKSKWEQMVEEKELGGYQLFANGNTWDSEIADDYLVNSIPRFILIGPDGKIIDSDAERPSGEIKERLEKLLSEEEKGDGEQPRTS